MIHNWYGLTVSDNDEMWYEDVVSEDENAIKRLRKMLADDYETSEGSELDLGERKTIHISDAMTDEQLREVADALAEMVGEYGDTTVGRKLCLFAPYPGSGEAYLCKLPFNHPQTLHEYACAESAEVNWHEFPRGFASMIEPETEPDDLMPEKIAAVPGQEGLPW